MGKTGRRIKKSRQVAAYNRDIPGVSTCCRSFQNLGGNGEPCILGTQVLLSFFNDRLSYRGAKGFFLFDIILPKRIGFVKIPEDIYRDYMVKKMFRVVCLKIN